VTAVFHRAEIAAALASVDLTAAMEAAFLAYSSGRAVVPPVGELLFEQPPGEVHIKYGYVRGEPYYVIKVASGFYHNPALGLSSSNGLMLLFSQETGELKAVLLDEGLLTDHRTAAAGALAARLFAPPVVDAIGILGTGIQAELQLRYLAAVTACRRVFVWGRSEAAIADYQHRLADTNFSIAGVRSTGDFGDCQLIVTTTPSAEPILHSVSRGTHVTAVGSDTAGKQELDAQLLAQADVVVVDSRAQAVSRGEVFHAVRSGKLDMDSVSEIGEVIAGERRGRQDAADISIVDLTGVATQDIAIAGAVYERLAGP
jgi:ornithine cyclodeaminase